MDRAERIRRAEMVGGQIGEFLGRTLRGWIDIKMLTTDLRPNITFDKARDEQGCQFNSIHRGIGRGQEPFNGCTILTACASESRGARGVSSTIPSGHWMGQVSIQQPPSTYNLRRRESRREAMSVERFHRGIGAAKGAGALT